MAELPFPIIDFSDFVTDDADKKQRVAADIRHACVSKGFLYIQNPPVDWTKVHRSFEFSQRFFDSPIEKKSACAYTGTSSNTGYVAVVQEKLDPSKPGDLKEAFNVSNPNQRADSNLWPAMDGFQEFMVDFFDTCHQTGITILRAYALALGLEEDFFSTKHQGKAHTLRLLHYPPSLQPPEPGQSRAGIHSDYGSITLLFQQDTDVGGLEVLTVDGEWVRAPPLPNCIVVNTGDLMMRWTNDLFVSTKHRVTIHPEAAEKHRYSTVFFIHPDDETVIEALPTSTGPARYPSISAGDYLQERLRNTYT